MPKPPVFVTVLPETVPVAQVSSRMPSHPAAVVVTVFPETVLPLVLLRRMATEPAPVIVLSETVLAAQESRMMPYFLGDLIVLPVATSLDAPPSVMP